MTKFVPVRTWSSKTGELLGQLRSEDTIVVTQNGQPAAYVIRANPATVDRDLEEVNRLRFDHATTALRTSAKASGAHKMSMKQIDSLVAKTRKDRRQRASS